MVATIKRREVILDMINRLNHMRSPKVKATYDNYVYTKPSGETDGMFVNSKTQNSKFFKERLF